MLASIAVKPAFAGGESGVEKITIIECGRAEATDKSMFTSGKNVGVPFTIPINCYHIHHSKGNLLWDTGLSDGLGQYPEGHEVRPDVIVIIEKRLARRLEDLGASPDSIKHLALSHLHQDHAGKPGAVHIH